MPFAFATLCNLITDGHNTLNQELSLRKATPFRPTARVRLCLQSVCPCSSLASALPMSSGVLHSIIENMGRIKTVVVIGAGFSGLRAASVLLRHGHHQHERIRVVVLEGRDRIGGRAYTSTSHAWHTPLDLGCAWIHGIEGNPMWDLACKTGIDALTFEISSIAISESRGDGDGTNVWLDGRDVETVMDCVFALGSRAVEYAKAEHAKIPPSASFKDFCDAAIEREETLTTPMHKVWATKMARYYTNVTAQEIERQSLRNYGVEEERPGAQPMLAATYAPILADVAQAAIDADVVTLQTKVVRVEDTEDGSGRLNVTARHMVTGETSEVLADAVICTVPLSLLQNDTIKFLPPVPKSLKSAFGELGMGTAEKLFIRMNSAFWITGEYPRDVDIYAFLPNSTDDSLVELISLAKFPVNKEPVLLLYSAAKQAQLIADMWARDGRAAVSEWIMGYIRRLPGYQETRACQIDDLFSTNWLADEFSLGSYSYSPTGSMDTQAACDRISKGIPERKIFFAGEHAIPKETPSEIGTSHGAYLSGEHAANCVLSVLKT